MGDLLLLAITNGGFILVSDYVHGVRARPPRSHDGRVSLGLLAARPRVRFGSSLWSGTANAKPKVKPRAQDHMAYFRDCCAFTPTQSACAARFGNGSSKVRGR
eukprot:scaffold78462_cov65-Phaeocystis_antarctica.AAC.3